MMGTRLLSRAHEQLREKVRAFARAEVAPRVARMEANPREVERELLAKIAGLGWIGVTIDRAYGGMGAGHLAKTLIIEELARVSGAIAAAVQASQLGVAKIIYWGSDEQRKQWLPRIAAGSCLPTIGVTEHGCGGYVADLETSARRRGKDYVLTGRKVYIGNSHIGDLHGVVARTGRGSSGLTAFLVEVDRPGLTLAPHRPALGLHGFSFGELILDNCRVPATNMIGQRGDGLSVAYSSSVLYGRPNLTAVALGSHQACLDETVRFATTRRRRGKPLADLHQTVAHKIGRMRSRLMTARQLAYHAVQLLDAGHPCDMELMNAKLVGVESLLASVHAGMEIHAAAGLQTDRPMERLLRDAYHLNAPAGTSDIQIHRLAQDALGRSRSQWSRRFATARQPSPGPVAASA
jgi:acyl-CoA dehydrogenase